MPLFAYTCFAVSVRHPDVVGRTGAAERAGAHDLLFRSGQARLHIIHQHAGGSLEAAASASENGEEHENQVAV